MNRRKALQAIVSTVLILCLGSTITSAHDQSETDIKVLLNNYEKALNSGNIAKVMTLYAKDSVFMPSNKPTATGYLQVEKAYRRVFEDLDLSVTFHIDEILTRDDLAIVRTVSDGEITLLKQNKTISNNSRELFIMKREHRHWKIYRYMFNEISTQH